MNDENNSDILELKADGEGNGETDISAERNIKPAPVVHTKPADETDVPISGENEADRLEAPVSGRFIKATATPHVSTVFPVKEEEELTAVDKYADRLTDRIPRKKEHTGYTGKLNTYTAAHAVPENAERMIAHDEKSVPPIQKAVTEDKPEPEKAAPEKEEETAKEAVREKSVTVKKIPADAPDDGDMKIADPKKLSSKKMKAPNNDATKNIDSKGSLLRRLAGAAGDGVRRNPDRMMLEGAGETEEEPEEITEEEKELQKELKKTREKRIKGYHVWNRKKEAVGEVDEKFSSVPQEKEVGVPFLQKVQEKFADRDVSFNPVESEEYTDYANRKAVSGAIAAERKKLLRQILIVILLGGVLLLLDTIAFASAAGNANGFFGLFGGNYIVYNTVNLVCLLGYAAVLFPELKKGFFSLMQLHPKADTSLLFLSSAAVLQTIASYFTQMKTEYEYHLIAPAAILCAVPFLLAKLFYYDNMRQCFKTVGTVSDKSYLRKVSDAALVTELVRDESGKEHKAVYAGKTRFIGHFLERSTKAAVAGMPSSRTVLITAGISVLLGFIALIVEKSPVAALSTLSYALTVSFPVSCLVATGIMLTGENKKLAVKSSFVMSLADARDFAVVDDIVIEATDVINAEVTGCITSKKVTEKQAVFCAAALASQFKSPLTVALRAKAEGMEDRFPVCETPVYEDKLGFSAWVSGCRVLLGTHALLENHSVPVPEESAVQKFLKDGETPVYMAIEGNFAAVFGVTYTPNPKITDDLQQWIKRGTNVLMDSCDASVTDTVAEALLGLPNGSVRCIGHQTAMKLSATKDAVSAAEDAGIVFGDSFESLCRCAAAAVGLDRSKRTAKIICDVGAYAGLILTFIAVITGAAAVSAAVCAVLLQFIWIIVPLAIHAFSSSGAFFAKINREKPDTAPAPDAQPEQPEEPSEEPQTEEPAEEKAPPKKTPAEEFVGGTFEPPASVPDDTPDREMYEALDRLSGMSDKNNKGSHTEKTEKPPVTKQKTRKPEEEEDDDENDGIPEMPGFIKNLSAGINRFTGKFNKHGNAGTEDKEEKPKETVHRKPSVLSELPVRQGDNTGRQEERSRQSYEEEARIQREEEEHTRLSFTPPEMPKAPHYNLSSNASSTPDPLEARFVPPAVSGIGTHFSESDFSRFEDDKIFASLKEEKK